MKNRVRFLLVALCICFSLNVAGKVTKISSAAKLISVIKEFNVPRGYIKLNKCTSKDKRPIPASIQQVSLNFNEYMIGVKGVLRVDNVFEALVPVTKLPGHPDPSEIYSTFNAMSTSSFTAKNLVVHGVRSVRFDRGKNYADVTLEFYDMNHRLMLEKTFSCPWDSAIEVVY